jgi:hypothetical protein
MRRADTTDAFRQMHLTRSIAGMTIALHHTTRRSRRGRGRHLARDPVAGRATLLARYCEPLMPAEQKTPAFAPPPPLPP